MKIKETHQRVKMTRWHWRLDVSPPTSQSQLVGHSWHWCRVWKEVKPTNDSLVVLKMGCNPTHVSQ